MDFSDFPAVEAFLQSRPLCGESYKTDNSVLPVIVRASQRRSSVSHPHRLKHWVKNRPYPRFHTFKISYKHRHLRYHTRRFPWSHATCGLTQNKGCLSLPTRLWFTSGLSTSVHACVCTSSVNSLPAHKHTHTDSWYITNWILEKVIRSCRGVGHESYILTLNFFVEAFIY